MLRYVPTLVGFVVLWLVLDRTAAGLGSYRGEAGLAVCAVTVAAALLAEFLLSRRRPFAAIMALGFGPSKTDALFWAVALCAAMLAFYPVYALATGAELSVHPGWLVLGIGIFAQGGVAEEIVFRGFLFRRFREGRSFWRAAGFAAIPFVAVHALSFFTMEFPIALASLLLAVSISFPLAWLYERSGSSIWPPATVHAVVQGSIKLVIVEEGAFGAMAIFWMAISGLAPWALFLLRPRSAASR